MTRLLVWDLPVRLFHVLLAVTFAGAFALSSVDDDSPVFAAHMLLGLVMAFMVALRVVWGFVGTRHARFADFVHGPRAILRYFGGVLRGRAGRDAGHNPGSSVAIFLMLALVVGLAVTGVLMGQGDESLEDLHGAFAVALLVVVGLHVAGVILHSVRQRENLTRSMIDGRKEVAPEQAIAGPRPVVGLVFLALTGLWASLLAAGFDPVTRRLELPIVAASLQLGEVESGGSGAADHDD
ncbi:MAG: cytochrome b/b6 domain-containing protein [Myxococcota bacterium]